MTMTLSMRAAQGSFFDSPKVLRAMDRATRQAFSKAGAFIRQRARTSIRKRKGISKPDSPPSSHVGLLRLIYFAWDSATKSLVVGPAKLNKPGAAPNVLEHGGEATLTMSGRLRADGSREPAMIRRARYRARPFMRPALEAEAENVPGLFAGQLKG